MTSLLDSGPVFVSSPVGPDDEGVMIPSLRPESMERTDDVLVSQQWAESPIRS